MVQIIGHHHFDQVDKISTKMLLMRLMTSSDDDMPLQYLQALLRTSFVSKMQIYRSRDVFVSKNKEAHPRVEKRIVSSHQRHMKQMRLKIKKKIEKNIKKRISKKKMKTKEMIKL